MTQPTVVTLQEYLARLDIRLGSYVASRRSLRKDGRSSGTFGQHGESAKEWGMKACRGCLRTLLLLFLLNLHFTAGTCLSVTGGTSPREVEHVTHRPSKAAGKSNTVAIAGFNAYYGLARLSTVRLHTDNVVTAQPSLKPVHTRCLFPSLPPFPS